MLHTCILYAVRRARFPGRKYIHPSASFPFHRCHCFRQCFLSFFSFFSFPHNPSPRSRRFRRKFYATIREEDSEGFRSFFRFTARISIYLRGIGQYITQDTRNFVIRINDNGHRMDRRRVYFLSRIGRRRVPYHFVIRDSSSCSFFFFLTFFSITF